MPKVSQGVTTCVVGNCGISLAPLVDVDPPPPLNLLGAREAFRFPTMAAYAAAVEAVRPAVNVAALVGHGTLRVATMDDPYRPARPDEQQRMAALADEAMRAGAVGLSSGVAYAPGAAADADELAMLASVVAQHGGVYTAHIRNEAERMAEALDEAFSAARRARARLIVSHFKCAMPPSWGRSRERLAQLDAARRVQDVGLDVYPYPASSTILRRDYLGRGVRVLVTFSEPHPEMTGRTLSDIATSWAVDEATAMDRLQPGGGVYFMMSEEDVRTVIAHPESMIGSDGLPHDVHPHPRLWGTFPRVLGRYVRDERVLSLEAAVHKMTGHSASRFNLADRGVLRAGAHADLTLFDAATVADRATFERPVQPAAGIAAVFVNGRLAFDGATSRGRNGRFLHGSGMSSG
jgi:N-acyl-D-amino-acid deacylase